MSLPTPRDVDAHVSRALLEAKSQLQRAFAEGVGTVRDFPDTLKQLQELDKVLDMEEAVETASSIRERLQEAKEESAGAHSHQLGKGQRVAVFLDGSSTSYAALRWALRAVVSPQDDLYLVNIMPYDEFLEDAEHLLQQGYDYAHHAGVKASKLHVRALSAQKWSSTSGVGESVVRFVEDSSLDLVVLGSRGMGSIKSSLLGALGMGSVSEFCLHNLKCPVLLVKDGCEVDAIGRKEPEEECANKEA